MLLLFGGGAPGSPITLTATSLSVATDAPTALVAVGFRLYAAALTEEVVLGAATLAASGNVARTATALTIITAIPTVGLTTVPSYSTQMVGWIPLTYETTNEAYPGESLIYPSSGLYPSAS